MSHLATDSLTAALQQASEGLLYMSESDYPYEVIHWEKAPLSPEFIRVAHQESCTVICLVASAIARWSHVSLVVSTPSVVVGSDLIASGRQVGVRSEVITPVSIT